MGGKRSVMTRAERIAAMKADKRMTDKNAKALNLPKTKVVEK
jgi:small basic protein (TIGR04137 family)